MSVQVQQHPDPSPTEKDLAVTKESDAGSMISIQKDDPATHPKRSRAKDFLLIGTVTLTMILNVSPSLFTRVTHPYPYINGTSRPRT